MMEDSFVSVGGHEEEELHIVDCPRAEGELTVTALVVDSPFSNVRGIYRRVFPDPEGSSGPVFECQRSHGGVPTYLCWRFGRWVFTSDVRSDSEIVGTDAASPHCVADPLLIPQQAPKSQWAQIVTRLEELTALKAPVDGVRPPDLIATMCKSRKQMRHGLRRCADDVEEFPSYRTEQFGDLTVPVVNLWHDRVRQEWLLTNEGQDMKEVLARASSNLEVDPTKVDWSDKGLDSIVEVWWHDQEVPEGWKDESFPPSGLELLGEHCDISDTEWIRAIDLDRNSSDALLFNDIDLLDVRLVGFMHGWLAAALAAAAEFPCAIKKLFPTGDNLILDGRLIVKLFDPVRQAWSPVEIDDYIPCHRRQWFERNAEPLYLQPWNNARWVVIVEKALAKLVGGYHQLQLANFSWAWQALTGENFMSIISRPPVCAKVKILCGRSSKLILRIRGRRWLLATNLLCPSVVRRMARDTQRRHS
eukprot:gnl/MRDRNA2_/MRDRNA2_18276_c0_seq1.p1 gnl/MRDRNA2_/MRDRNA2_18276_c0~~gnl/MRDRNA2_/MRDRNA2_18276_c0_seq1.p1  ORF type:complete len:474 (+),score=64.19 gnl/MRDRNA2_/MRDRNA2_18276_c0_seq1:46-1467(+)